MLLFAFLLVGFAVAQNKDPFAASQKVDHCLAINVDIKIENIVAVKPCTPSGWWCIS